MTDFMNLLSITGQIKYSPAYHNQESFKESKSNSSRASDTKAIIGFSFKVRLQITLEKESDFKNQDKRDKGKKPYKSKAHAYLTNGNEEREIEYYDFNDDTDEEETKTNHEKKESSSETSNQESPFVRLTEPFMTYKCKKCKSKFPFNNKLHRHVRNQCSGKSCEIRSYTVVQNKNQDENDLIDNEDSTKTSFTSKKSLSIITSTIDLNQELRSGFDFREYQYVTALLSFTKKVVQQTNCFDIDADFIIMNKAFFLSSQSKELIKTMTTEITIREIGVNKHKTKEYVVSLIYFQKKNSFEKKVQACLKKEIHLIENFKINILIDTDVLTLERFVLDFKRSQTLIDSCDVIISITFRRHSKSMIHHMISLKEIIIISPRSQFRVKIHHLILPHGRDYLFEPENTNFSMYAHVIGPETNDILLRNEKNKSVRVSRNFRLDRVMKLDYLNVYQISADAMNLTIKRPEQSHQKTYFERLLRADLLEQETNEPTVQTKDGITIHNADSAFIKRFIELIKDHFVI